MASSPGGNLGGKTSSIQPGHLTRAYMNVDIVKTVINDELRLHKTS